MTRRDGPVALVALLLALCSTSAASAQQKLSIAEKECLLMERGNHTHRHMSRDPRTTDRDPRLLQTITVYENDPAYLHCKIPAQGKHLVAWTRVSDEALLTAGQQSFTSDARFQVSVRASNDWVLIIRRVERSDEGCYLCEVNTEPTSTIFPVFLRVTEKPSSEAAQVAESSLPHKKSSKLLARMNGDEVILNCTVEVDGESSPEVKWTKDGRLIKIDDSQKYISKVKRGSNVMVHELRIRSPSSSDDGYYACEGQNIPRSAQMVHVNTSSSQVQTVARISSVLTLLAFCLSLL
uniref:Ig-like domain-containing protein n=1 Tax=Steinernema glaseri TaxID=37863 RepID=A0A1I7ZG97_9BILA